MTLFSSLPPFVVGSSNGHGFEPPPPFSRSHQGILEFVLNPASCVSIPSLFSLSCPAACASYAVLGKQPRLPRKKTVSARLLPRNEVLVSPIMVHLLGTGSSPAYYCIRDQDTKKGTEEGIQECESKKSKQPHPSFCFFFQRP